MPEITFVIPYASYHADVVKRAVDSVIAQTIPCNVLTIEDAAGRGSGWARNQGLRQVKTPMVVFLDADDTVDSQFAEHCLLVWGGVKGTRYIYTNWIGNNRVHVAAAPCDMWKTLSYQQLPEGADPKDYQIINNEWVRATWHPVTTMIPTEYARRIGGFDEAMTALEDVDFYKRLIISGVCGIHLNEPLFNYSPGGQRSITARIEQDGVFPEQQMIMYMAGRYAEYTMGCCGDYELPKTPVGDRQDGDVLAQAQWAGNDQKRGLHTGRLYPRASFPKVVYVDPLDVAAAPHMWKKVSAVPQSVNPALQPGYNQQTGNWQGAAALAFGGGTPQAEVPAQMEWEYKPVENPRTKNDVLQIARRKTGDGVDGALTTEQIKHIKK